MVIDSSAIVAILLDEPERKRFIDAIVSDLVRIVSVASLLEVSIAMRRRILGGLDAEADDLVRELQIRLADVDALQFRLAREASARFGRGHHPAALNFGDCFSYALSKATGEPLLFKGTDFTQTDIQAVAW